MNRDRIDLILLRFQELNTYAALTDRINLAAANIVWEVLATARIRLYERNE